MEYPQEVAPLAVSKLRVHDHPCSIYDGAEELKRQVIPYLQAGLLLGEHCIYFHHENSEQFVLNAMQENNFDIEFYLEQGAFKIVSTDNAHLSGGFFSEDKMLRYWQSATAEALRLGFKTLRAAVEMTWALSELPGCDTLAPYEAKLNRFTDSHCVSILCAYNRRKFPPALLKSIILAHPLVVHKDNVNDNPLVVAPENFGDCGPITEVQAMLDGLDLINRLSERNARLEELTKQYNALYKELHTLARTVSHELQEPVNLIISYLRLLSVRYTDRLGDDADEFISRSVCGARTVARMIDDLWTYARIDTRIAEEVDCLQVLGEVLVTLEDKLQKRHAEVNTSKLPSVLACREHVKYVLAQLIENAINHGSVRPRIYVSAAETQQGWQFAVNDNGPGIEQSQSGEIFQLFNRAGKRPDESGSGMGLSIAKRMVEHHNGRLWYQSTPGVGTTFYFTLQGLAAAPFDCSITDLRRYAANKRSIDERGA